MAMINRPMYEHFAARHLAVKGPGALTQLEEGVFGNLPLDLSSDPSYWFIQGIRTYSTYQAQAAGAGLYSKIGIGNPANSGILIRILAWNPFVALAPSTNVLFSVQRCARGDITHSGTPGLYGYGTDTRINIDQPSKGEVIIAQDNTQPGQYLWAMDSDNAAEILGQTWPIVISPGEVVYVNPYYSGVAIQTSIAWVEVPAYKAEL